MSVTVHIDFSNGVMKTFAGVDLGTNPSVTNALDVAATMPPGLTYEFESAFTDRAGREVGRVRSIDGVGGSQDNVWGIWVNDRAVSDLRRVTDDSFTHVGGVHVDFGDIISLKLMHDG